MPTPDMITLKTVSGPPANSTIAYISIAASVRILGRHNIPEYCFQWISTLSGPIFLLRADLPMI